MITPGHTTRTQHPLSDWRTVRFDQIADNIAERVEPAEAETDIYVGLEHLDPNSLRLRRWGTPADVEGTKLRFYPGDVIFGRRRAYQRKLAVAEVEGICSAHAMVLRAKPDVCLPEFLPFFLQSERFFERAIAISVGSLSPTINWKTLAMQEFSLPPLDEQRRIAEILWAAEEAVEQRTRVVADLEQLRRALQEAYFAGTDKDGWRTVKLGKLFKVELGKAISPDVRHGSSPKPYLRNANVYWRRFDLVDVKEMNFDEAELGRYSLQAGDLLACEARAVGRSAIWNGEIEECYYQNALHRLRSLRGELRSELMLEFLSFASAKGLLIPLVGEMTIPHLPAAKLRELLVPVPPVEVQVKMVEVFDGMEQGIRCAERSVSASQKLFGNLREHLIGGSTRP